MRRLSDGNTPRPETDGGRGLRPPRTYVLRLGGREPARGEVVVRGGGTFEARQGIGYPRARLRAGYVRNGSVGRSTVRRRRSVTGATLHRATACAPREVHPRRLHDNELPARFVRRRRRLLRLQPCAERSTRTDLCKGLRLATLRRSTDAFARGVGQPWHS